MTRTPSLRTLSRIALTFAVVLLAGMGETPPASRAAPNAAALKRVMLSTGGVGYFEFEAVVNGTQDVTLPIRADSADDILKSLVIFDDGGGAGSVRLPSEASNADIFRDLPLDASDLSSLGRILDRLKGVEVTIDGPRRVTGRIVSVSVETVTDGEATTSRHRVTLINADGLQHLILEDSLDVRFLDPDLNRRFEQALTRFAARANAGNRTLTVNAAGEGQRTLTIGYVAEVPLWKASYRMVLPAADTADEEDARARLQGWAILENTSGQDWNNVELTILSGNPVTFRQALYATYYVDRPEVPVDVLARIVPRVDEGEMASDPKTIDELLDQAADGMRRERRARAEEFSRFDGSMAMPEAGPDELFGSQAEQMESVTQVVFTLPDPVTVPQGESLIAPIIDERIAASRVAWRQQNETGVFAAVDLDNESGFTLPPGAVTVYEVVAGSGADARLAYLGDARLAFLPQGDRRLIAYALDTKTTIDAEQDSDRRRTSLKIADGVLEVTSLSRAISRFTVAAPAEEDRAVVIEVPRNRNDTDETVEAPDADIAVADDVYRIRVDVAAGETRTVPVSVESPITQRLILTSLDARTIAAYVADQSLDAPTREVFEDLAALRAAVDAQNRLLQRIAADRERIFAEQERIRENLESVPENSTLQRRYLTTLNDQEDTLAALEAERLNAESARRAAEAELEAYIREIRL